MRYALVLVLIGLALPADAQLLSLPTPASVVASRFGPWLIEQFRGNLESSLAMLFFQLMSRRYERAATVLTNNKSFDEWDEVFGDDVTASALIDRLVHHCHNSRVNWSAWLPKLISRPVLSFIALR